MNSTTEVIGTPSCPCITMSCQPQQSLHIQRQEISSTSDKGVIIDLMLLILLIYSMCHQFFRRTAILSSWARQEASVLTRLIRKGLKEIQTWAELTQAAMECVWRSRTTTTSGSSFRSSPSGACCLTSRRTSGSSTTRCGPLPHFKSTEIFYTHSCVNNNDNNNNSGPKGPTR